MRKLYAIFQLSCIACLFCCGCKLSNDDKDVVVKIEPEFLLGMKEDLSEVRDFQLTFKSARDQSCVTNRIDFSSEHTANTIRLNLIEIIEDADCQLGEGPVEGSASYNFLPLGTYKLDLFLKNTVHSKGQLVVTNEKYDLEIEDGFGFQLTKSNLMRVPNSLVWGYIAFKDGQLSPKVDEFMSQLNAKTSSLKLGKGDYGYFLMGDGEKLSLASTPDYNNFKTFYRLSIGQISELESLLASFRSQYPGGEMEFKIYTWQGQTL